MATTSPGPGRPRDRAVDERVINAALGLYGDVGWSGFSLEAVARRAGVSKGSIYLRWSSKDELLDDALVQNVAGGISTTDTGSLKTDLTHLARSLLALYLGSNGRAALRLMLEGEVVEAIRPRFEDLQRSQVRAARGIVERAIERDQLSAQTSVTILLDTLCGGAMLHAIGTPQDLREQVAARADDYVDQLVDFLVEPLLPR
jgi:AcrR family transcriptional regulator